jgi:hypothetical protein
MTQLRPHLPQAVPPEGYKPGQLYSFRTLPSTRFSPPETGRYGCLKILGSRGGCIYHVVLDGIFDHAPSFDEVAELPWLNFFDRGPCRRAADETWSNELPDFRYIGLVPLTQADVALFENCQTFGLWEHSAGIAEGAWRKRHDAEAFEKELVLYREDQEKRAALQRERYEQRLKSLTWDKLLSERPFARWDEGDAFPSAEFTEAARERVRQDIERLRALGPKPGKRDVRAVIKASVLWFNALDTQFGEVIETEEREDICAVYEELAFVARRPDVAREIEKWRNW